MTLILPIYKFKDNTSECLLPNVTTDLNNIKASIKKINFKIAKIHKKPNIWAKISLLIMLMISIIVLNKIINSLSHSNHKYMKLQTFSHILKDLVQICIYIKHPELHKLVIFLCTLFITRNLLKISIESNKRE